MDKSAKVMWTKSIRDSKIKESSKTVLQSDDGGYLIAGWRYKSPTSIVQEAEASQKRINEFLKHQPEIVNTNLNPSEIIGAIEFKNVTFTYDDTNIVGLKNVSFNIPQGQTLAVLANTGSGKSTIINLIARLYDVDNGEILIDNKNIKNLNLDNLRQNIGFVPQEAFLFSDTIKKIKKGGGGESDTF